MGAEDKAKLVDEPPPPRSRKVVLKYVCAFAALVALLLIALLLSYPFNRPPKSDVIDDSEDVSTNEIDDSAPDGYRPTKKGYKKEKPVTTAQPSSPSTTSRATTQSWTTTTTTTTPSKTTVEPTTKSNKTRRGAPEHGPAVTTPKSSSTPSPTTKVHAPTAPPHVGNATSRRPPRVRINATDLTVPSNRTNASNHLYYTYYAKRVSVQLIYECHCPRSRMFIVSQLLPVYEKLRDHMNLTLLPFGRALIANGTKSKSPSFSCQRGYKECLGDMIHTCILRGVQETLTAVRIIACMSRSPDPHSAGRRCVESYGLEWHRVDKCVAENGKLYLLDMGKKTWKIAKTVDHVPIVLVEGDASHTIQVEAQLNLMGLICRRVPYSPACSGRRHSNGTTTTPMTTATGPEARRRRAEK
ncbi:uncharacterized protein LOC144163316 [Haemaphysalis longicornis]